MNNIESVIKAFREARIAGEQLLARGEIRWTDYAEMMIGFERILQEMGVEL